MSKMQLNITQDFYLSDIVPEDALSYVEFLNNKQIYSQTLSIPYPYTLKDSNWWINHVSDETLKQGRSVNWAIRNKDKKLIGGLGFHGFILGKDHKAELGYWLAKTYWNQGIMTQAVKCASNLAFNEFGLIRIEAHIFAFNRGSARVLEKAGFEEEGTLKNFYKKDGIIFDAKLYAKVQSLNTTKNA